MRWINCNDKPKRAHYTLSVRDEWIINEVTHNNLNIYSTENVRVLRPSADLRVLPSPFPPSFTPVQSSHPTLQRPPQPRVMSIRTCVQRGLACARISTARIKIDKGGSYIIGTAAQRGEEKRDRGPGQRDLRARLVAVPSRARAVNIAKRIYARAARVANVPDRHNGALHALWIGNPPGSRRADAYNGFNAYRRWRVSGSGGDNDNKTSSRKASHSRIGKFNFVSGKHGEDHFVPNPASITRL